MLVVKYMNIGRKKYRIVRRHNGDFCIQRKRFFFWRGVEYIKHNVYGYYLMDVAPIGEYVCETWFSDFYEAWDAFEHQFKQGDSSTL